MKNYRPFTSDNVT